MASVLSFWEQKYYRVKKLEHKLFFLCTNWEHSFISPRAVAVESLMPSKYLSFWEQKYYRVKKLEHKLFFLCPNWGHSIFHLSKSSGS
jgi:hypothetical protein